MAMHRLAKQSGFSANPTKPGKTLAIALALTLTSCQTPKNLTTPANPTFDNAPGVAASPAPASELAEILPTPSTPSQETGEPVGSEHGLIPGRHCYALNSDRLTAAIGVTVTEDNRVLGESQGTIHNEAVGYFSSYGQTFDGQIAQDQLTLDLTSYTEGDVQQAQETWTLEQGQLNTGQDLYASVDCAEVQAQLAIAGDDADGAAGAAEEPTVAPVKQTTAALNDLTEGANYVRVQRLSFAPGESSAVVEDAVVRGDRDEYLVGAAAGQTMTVSISSLEQNAVFGVARPDGTVLIREETFAALALPQTGDYSIVVGGTRGNASYGLEVEIR